MLLGYPWTLWELGADSGHKRRCSRVSEPRSSFSFGAAAILGVPLIPGTGMHAYLVTYRSKVCGFPRGGQGTHKEHREQERAIDQLRSKADRLSGQTAARSDSYETPEELR